MFYISYLLQFPQSFQKKVAHTYTYYNKELLGNYKQQWWEWIQYHPWNGSSVQGVHTYTYLLGKGGGNDAYTSVGVVKYTIGIICLCMRIGIGIHPPLEVVKQVVDMHRYTTQTEWGSGCESQMDRCMVAEEYWCWLVEVQCHWLIILQLKTLLFPYNRQHFHPNSSYTLLHSSNLCIY